MKIGSYSNSLFNYVPFRILLKSYKYHISIILRSLNFLMILISLIIYKGYPRTYSRGYSRWYSSARYIYIYIYIGNIGGTPSSANSSIGYYKGYCFLL